MGTRRRAFDRSRVIGYIHDREKGRLKFLYPEFCIRHDFIQIGADQTDTLNI